MKEEKMIRLLDKNYGRNLYKTYLQSIQPERVPEIGFSVEDLQVEFDPETQLSHQKVLGSIRMLDNGEHLILYMAVEKLPNGDFRVLKISDMVQFQSHRDLPFKALLGTYIVEFDNAFILHHSEIAGSVVLDEVDDYSFMQITDAWEHESLQPRGKSHYEELMDVWIQIFRIKEHEITCQYRSRDTSSKYPLVWVPQLELGKDGPDFTEVEKANHDVQRYLQNESLFMRDIVLLCQIARFERLDYEATKQTVKPSDLVWEKDGSILLYIPRKKVGKPGSVFCGAYPIFKGILPEALTLTKNSGMIKNKDLDSLEFSFD